jgi:hypothetical protein
MTKTMSKTVNEMLEDAIKSSNECLIEIYSSDECILTIEQQKAKQQAITTNNTPSYSVNIGDIHLHDVQNTKDFGAALMKYIPGEFGRQLCGRTR